jgi:hypothetical protein
MHPESAIALHRRAARSCPEDDEAAILNTSLFGVRSKSHAQSGCCGAQMRGGAGFTVLSAHVTMDEPFE